MAVKHLFLSSVAWIFFVQLYACTPEGKSKDEMSPERLRPDAALLARPDDTMPPMPITGGVVEMNASPDGLAGTIAGEPSGGILDDGAGTRGGASGGSTSGGSTSDSHSGGIMMSGPECPLVGSLCDAACNWLTDCTLGDGCEGLDQTDGPAVRSLCMERCQANDVLANVICGHNQCEESLAFMRNDLRFDALCRGESLPEMDDPVIAQCSALSSCLNGCSDNAGGQNCIDQCYNNATPEAAQRYGAIITCVRQNQCINVFNRVDQECLYDRCGREMERCFGRPILPMGEGSCFELLQCINDCPDRLQFPDQSRVCVTDCIETTEPDSHALYQDALDCVQQTNCADGDGDCQNQFCGDEIDACIDDGRPVGNADCREVSNCFWACFNAECQQQCYNDGTREAQALFGDVLDCANDANCFGRVACERACPVETLACLGPEPGPVGMGGNPLPVGGVVAPVGGAPAPVGGVPSPVGGVIAPVGGAPAPVGMGGNPLPVGGVVAPVGGAPAPVGMGGNPLPVGGVVAPVGGAPAPVEMGGNPSPVGGVVAPVGGVQAPVGGVPSPVGGNPGPGGGTLVPLGGVPSPSGGNPGSVAGAVAPVGGVVAPSGGNSVPTGGVVAPGGSIPSPVDSGASPRGGGRTLGGDDSAAAGGQPT